MALSSIESDPAVDTLARRPRNILLGCVGETPDKPKVVIDILLPWAVLTGVGKAAVLAEFG